MLKKVGVCWHCQHHTQTSETGRPVGCTQPHKAVQPRKDAVAAGRWDYPRAFDPAWIGGQECPNYLPIEGDGAAPSIAEIRPAWALPTDWTEVVPCDDCSHRQRCAELPAACRAYQSWYTHGKWDRLGHARWPNPAILRAIERSEEATDGATDGASAPHELGSLPREAGDDKAANQMDLFGR